jgi:hypothetical protein
MYLNRFTISASPDNSLSLEKLKPFNSIYTKIEDRLFKMIPKKVNVGGYGYVSIKLHPHENRKDWIKEYGQCVDCNLYNYPFKLEDFLSKKTSEQWNEVLLIYKKGLSVLAANLDVDEAPIRKALDQISKENI